MSNSIENENQEQVKKENFTVVKNKSFRRTIISTYREDGSLYSTNVICHFGTLTIEISDFTAKYFFYGKKYFFIKYPLGLESLINFIIKVFKFFKDKPMKENIITKILAKEVIESEKQMSKNSTGVEKEKHEKRIDSFRRFIK